MDIDAIKKIVEEVGDKQIVVASKYLSAEQIKALSGLGLHYYGENRVDALLSKLETLEGDPNIEFHFIGHLQSNKAKLVANRIACLHSLDSIKTARILNDALEKPLDCYIELHLTDNDAKSGVAESQLPDFIISLKAFPNIHVIGLMAMSDADMDESQKRAVFRKARQLADQYGYTKLSMGMSDDYLLAIEEGATSLRLGRVIAKHC